MDEPVIVVTDARAYGTLAEQAQRAGRLLAVAYGSDWSKPARDALVRFGRIAQRHPDVLCAAVNVDACRALATAHGVASVPSFRVLRDGREVGAVEGANLSVVRTYIRAYRHARSPTAPSATVVVVGRDGSTEEEEDDDDDDDSGPVCRRDGRVLTWSGYIDRASVLDEPPRGHTLGQPQGGARLGSSLGVPPPAPAGSTASNVICIDDDDDEGSGGNGNNTRVVFPNSNSSKEDSDEARGIVEMLTSMGFEAEQAREALAQHRGRPCPLETLVDWIIAHPTAGIARQTKRPRPIQPAQQQTQQQPQQPTQQTQPARPTQPQPKRNVDGPAVALRVRQPDGAFIRGAFRGGHTLRDVFRWVAASRTDAAARGAAFSLVLACPRTVFRGDERDGTRTLAECGLVPAASLMLTPVPHT